MSDIWIQVRRVVGGIETIREVTVTAEVARDKDLFERVLDAALRDRSFVQGSVADPQWRPKSFAGGDFSGQGGGRGPEFIRHGHGTNVRI